MAESEPPGSPIRSLIHGLAASAGAGAELPPWGSWPGVPIGGGRTMAHPVPAAAVPVVLWLARAGQGCTGCALPFPFLTWCGCATRVVLRREGDSPPPPTGGPACPGLAMGSGCAVAPLLRACWSGNRPAAPQCPTCSHGTHYSPPHRSSPKIAGGMR